MRTRAPFREGQGWLAALEGHAGPVLGCAISPNSAYMVSASVDETLKVGIEMVRSGSRWPATAMRGTVAR
jgi:hypothetical protein